MSEIVCHENDFNQSSDACYKEGGSSPIKSMWNFTSLKFHQFWMCLSDHGGKNWNVGNGWQTALTGEDIPFLSMSV